MTTRDERTEQEASDEPGADDGVSESERLLFGGPLRYDMGWNQPQGSFLELGLRTMVARMPRLIAATIRLAHRADPRALRRVAIAELGGGVAQAVGLVAVNRVLAQLLGGGDTTDPTPAASSGTGSTPPSSTVPTSSTGSRSSPRTSTAGPSRPASTSPSAARTPRTRTNTCTQPPSTRAPTRPSPPCPGEALALKRVDWEDLVHESMTLYVAQGAEDIREALSAEGAGPDLQALLDAIDADPAVRWRIADRFSKPGQVADATGRTARELSRPALRRALNQLVTIELTARGAARWQLSWSDSATLRYPADGFEDQLGPALDAAAAVADQPDTESLRKLVLEVTSSRL